MRNEKYIPIAQPLIGDEEAKAVYDLIKSGWISMGKKVEEFEQLCSEYLGVKNSIAMNNGTSTLSALMTALEINSDDEIIIPNLTYISTANVVEYRSAKLVLADNDSRTFNIDADLIKKKITNKTKLVMTVDLKGQPVDYDSILELCESNNIYFVSDSAESFGADYKNNKVGSQALAHSFSFFANKNLTTGEGGLITTNDDNLANKLRIIRNQGQEGRYNHTMLGNNFRMTDITAAIGIEQLKKIENVLNQKQKIARLYNNLFQDFSNIKTPFIADYSTKPTWYMYSISVDQKLRNRLIKFLKDKSIDTRLSFPPISTQPYYVNKYKFSEVDLRNSIYNYNTFLDIPVSILMTEDDQKRVANEIINFIKKNEKANC